MLDALRAEPKAARQFLLLSHLYARCDSASLAWLRRALLNPRYTPAQVHVWWCVEGSGWTGSELEVGGRGWQCGGDASSVHTAVGTCFNMARC
jgi:hypothetical protein